jgi:hypothetical protein
MVTITRHMIKAGARQPTGERRIWWIECKYSGRGQHVVGTFAQACAEALKYCTRPCWDRWVIWDRGTDPQDSINQRAADVHSAGIAYLFLAYQSYAQEFPAKYWA